MRLVRSGLSRVRCWRIPNILMKVASLEKCRRRVEDKIQVAGDERVVEVVPSAIHEQRILPFHESAISENDTISIDSHSDSLADGAGAILECQVVGGEVVGIDDDRRRTEGSNRPNRPERPPYWPHKRHGREEGQENHERCSPPHNHNACSEQRGADPFAPSHNDTACSDQT